MNPKHTRSTWLVLFCAIALAGACGGDDDDDAGDNNDDGGAAVCGDGVINGTEECDGETLGSATCSSVDDFTGGALACAADCTFDTSACTTEIPEDCGNGAIDEGEDCDGTELGGATCDSIAGFSGGDLACAAGCGFDTSGCEASPSGQIAAARAATDGSGLSLPISGAVVTYVRPQVGGDPAGFFIQAEQAGPALFVTVLPAVADPTVGDTVSFTITEKATDFGQPRAVAIADFTVDASGTDVTALAQDVSADATLVSALGDFDSELITLEATITSDFIGASAPSVAADIATAGLPADPGLRFRLDGALRDTLDLANGCAVRIGPTPLWRFNETAQPSIWAPADISISSCNAPRVVEASAPSATTVVVTFDRRIAAATVQPADFTFDNGLAATATAVDARTVTVTTGTQTAQTAYTVTVAGLTDTLGADIDGAADTGSFAGFGDNEVACDDNADNDADGDIDCFDSDCAEAAACNFEPQLYLWEVDTDLATMDETAEFVEVVNRSGGAINFANEGWYVMLVNGNGDLAYRVTKLGPTAGTMADGDVWTVGNIDSTITVDQEDFGTGLFQNGTDGVLLIHCDLCTGVADFAAGFDPGTGNTVTSTSGAVGTKEDAIVYGSQDDPELQAKLLNVTQVPDDTDVQSLQRTSLGNWLQGAPTPGAVQ